MGCGCWLAITYQLCSSPHPPGTRAHRHEEDEQSNLTPPSRPVDVREDEQGIFILCTPRVQMGMGLVVFFGIIVSG